ncbi:MAG: tRNA lysidine(34) synthetase TilS, partial [Chitinophagaceae bacterium]
RQKGNEVHIPVKQLMGFRNRALIYEIISPFGFLEKQVEEVVKLAASESGKYILSPEGHYRIIRHRHWFIISPVQALKAATIIIEEEDKEVFFFLGKLGIERTSDIRPAALNNEASLDARKIQFPLLLRRWKTGDYFYPLGMTKKKKISRFLMDKKLSLTEKENIWVIESAQRIIWVVGHRIDERFKVTDTTTKVLRLTMQTL